MAKINKDDLKIGVTFRPCKDCDRVEVVFCKDCKFRKTEDCAMFYECDCGEQHAWECDNDFCSWGERREHNQ